MLSRIDLLERIKKDSLELAQFYGTYIEVVINVNASKQSSVVNIIIKSL